MSGAKFAITRPDGRSNAEVLCEVVRKSDPGTVITYDELCESLSHDNKAFSKADVQSVVNQSYITVLNSEARALRCVPRVGYEVCAAKDHRSLALRRQRRGNTQLWRGYVTLQKVRWDEMDPQSRLAHEGTLMMMTGVIEQQRQLEKRTSRIEDVLVRAIGGVRESRPGPA